MTIIEIGNVGGGLWCTETHWIEWDKNSVHIETVALIEKNEELIGAHITCALAAAESVKSVVENAILWYPLCTEVMYDFRK